MTKVVSSKNLPMRLPLAWTLLGWLALDHWNAPSWAYGAFWAILGIVWVVAIRRAIWLEESVDIFSNK